MIFMIVEDDPNIMFLLDYYISSECQLKSNNFVDLTTSLAFVETTRPDAILLDYFLGSETADRFAEFLQTKYSDNLPIICLVTAAPKPKEIAARLKVNYLLEKPFELEHLHAIVEELCEIKKFKKIIVADNNV